MPSPSTGIDTEATEPASIPAPARCVVRIITIEIEGDSLAVSMAIGSVLAHALRGALAPEAAADGS